MATQNPIEQEGTYPLPEAQVDRFMLVTPEDIKAIGPDVLRHRIIRSYEAEAEEITSDQIVRRIFETVEVP
jgi:MoxR-like ATPase